MTSDSCHETEGKRCIVPGCNKPLPSDSVIPICDQHIDEAREAGLKIGSGILTLVGGAYVFIKNDGMKYVGKAADLAKRFLK